jgi:CubicO group peptidase (beta-lactamase class C family)
MFLFRAVAVVLALSTLIVALPGHAEAPLPSAGTPGEVGLDAAQLKRIEAVTQAHVDSGVVPGAHMLIARRGKIAWQARLGYRDTKEAMPQDAIFRIYSMTKPITSVVAMMLLEDGRLQVGEPVTKYLPEIGDMKVGTEKPSGEGKPVLELSAPARAMTVQDLLRHTSGLTYGEFGNSLVHTLYKEAKIGDRTLNNAQFVSALSKMPLRFSPGTRFEYGRSTDVMGRIIEVIEGRSLGEVLAARVLGPLGMTDTAFGVPAAKLGRAVQPKMEAFYDMAQKAAFEGGGEGLTSTMEDYLRFALMLANRGTGNGKRLLGPQTVDYMTADHLGAIPGFAAGQGFGLGVMVRTRPGEAVLPGSVGEYGWSGYAGTTFWIDPKRELIAIYMAQVKPANRVMLLGQFREMVQAAINE